MIPASEVIINKQKGMVPGRTSAAMESNAREGVEREQLMDRTTGMTPEKEELDFIAEGAPTPSSGSSSRAATTTERGDSGFVAPPSTPTEAALQSAGLSSAFTNKVNNTMAQIPEQGESS